MVRTSPPQLDFSKAAFAAAVIVLAIGPIHWLVQTWFDPAFDSHGFAYFAGVVLLAVLMLAGLRRRARNPKI